MLDVRLDFSVTVVKATQQLCRELGTIFPLPPYFRENEQFARLGIRYSEELSLKRFIPPEILRKGLGFEADQAGPPPIRPGEVLREGGTVFLLQ